MSSLRRRYAHSVVVAGSKAHPLDLHTDAKTRRYYVRGNFAVGDTLIVVHPYELVPVRARVRSTHPGTKAFVRLDLDAAGHPRPFEDA